MAKNFITFANKFRNGFVLALCFLVAFSLDSCKKDEVQEEPEQVVFPEAQTIITEAGATQVLHFSINVNWTLTSDANWATFDGELSVSGAAGEISVELTVSDEGQTPEETSTAHITLSAGGESQVIYTINRTLEDVEFIITDSDGNEVTTLKAGWNYYETYTITANFEYAVTVKPDWVETGDVSENAEFNVAFRVVDDASYYKYPQKGEITFANEAGNFSFPYTITSDGMDAEEIIIDGPGNWNWTATGDGKTFYCEGIETEPAFTIAALNDKYVIAVADYTWADDWCFYVKGSDNYDDEDAAWIQVTDDGKGNISLTCDATTSERKAYVLAFPKAQFESAENFLYFIYDSDEEELLTEYESNVIVDLEQTLSSASEAGFAVLNGKSYESVEVEDTCPEQYKTAINSVISQYSPVAVGYIEYEIGVNYITTVLPLDTKAEWIWNTTSYDANGKECYGQSCYSIEAGSSYYVGSTSYPSYSIEVESDPGVNYFYVLYTDDSGNHYLLFFYGETSGGSADTPEWGFAVQNGLTYESVEVQYTYTGAYGSEIEKMIAEYESVVKVGYVEYEIGVNYITTVLPLDAEAYWICENYSAYDSWEESLQSPDQAEYYELEPGSSYYSGGKSYPSVSVEVKADPNVHFFYIVYEDDDENCGLLFFSPGKGGGDSGSETPETGFGVINGQTYEAVEVATEYNGSSASKMASVVKEYEATNVGYVEYEIGVNYITTVLPLDAEAYWICENFSAYDSWEESLQSPDQAEYYELEPGSSYYSGGKSYPSVSVEVIEDPGVDYFYIVYEDDDENCSVLFFYPGEGGDSGSGEGTGSDAAFVVLNSLTQEQYECSDSYSGTWSSVGVEPFLSNVNPDHVAYLVGNWGPWTGDTHYPYLVVPCPLSTSNEFGWEGSLIWDDGTTTWFEDYVEAEGGQNAYINGVSYPATLVDVIADPQEVFGVVFKNGSETWALVFIPD